MRSTNMHRYLTGLIVLVLTVSSGGCGEEGGTPPKSAGADSPEAREARLLERCAGRWEKVVQNDWIEAYDFLSPRERKTYPLPEFLKGKAHHRYEKPEAPRMVKVDGDRGYVLAACMWTPVHPALNNLDVGSKEDLTQRLEVVETWGWTDGDWFYASAQASSEFFAEHPEVPGFQPEPVSR